MRAVASAAAGLSCDEVCAAAGGAACVVDEMAAINSCAALGAAFPCAAGCTSSMGADQPAAVDARAPPEKAPGACLVNADTRLFSCAGTWEWARRLCPCAGGADAAEV